MQARMTTVALVLTELTAQVPFHQPAGLVEAFHIRRKTLLLSDWLAHNSGTT